MKIQDVINQAIKGETRKNALDFVEYLQENGVLFPESDNYFWDVTFEGTHCLPLTLKTMTTEQVLTSL